MISLQKFAHSRLSWLVLLLSAVALELSALFFQYGMKLDPCVMCVYQRVAVLGLAAAGIVGLVMPSFRLIRVIAAIIWGISAGWGLKLAIELNDIQQDPSPFATCSFMPDFPKWLQLHEWFPSVFMPTGMCTDIPWTFLGVTMAQWMIVVFATYLFALAIYILPILRRPHY
ncbi:disulfide bond formation protein DsbB [Shewanella yunxiaonensis]|uniref:Disulfide bond formation protein B n=1 Tax=Shewanella yunxiaonensis TaxID=2829809 RepID=A0ABX7YQ35_9GAMM|nr:MULTISPECIES: disulfide bond formation protein DsbB [Shewanella]MDF0535957.1 disulfide bond formation protein DsbB [Shewanella sp. A32]QUN04520.1 disulfide bond formation protein DsbB [Shewanella yunxiaonensis]